ncbi:hypothetical protein DFJ74DRAFT_768114 [Hyaloraphidium curvatum]|nr:hypothetical protein DFJ74DRAFT_768114 [Hyaloraphidium curvatum]
METVSIGILIHDGTAEKPLYEVGRLPLLAGAARDADARKAREGSYAKSGLPMAVRFENEDDEVPFGVMVVPVCNSETCLHAANLFLNVKTSETFGLPLRRLEMAPLDLDLRLCTSFPEGMDPSFADKHVLRQMQLSGDLVDLETRSTLAAFEPASQLALFEGFARFFTADLACIVCGGVSAGFYFLYSFGTETWPWTFCTDFFPMCNPEDKAYTMLRRCWANCGVRALEPGVERFRRCSRCKAATYCSEACQRRDWPAHKKVCVPRTDPAPGK